jgi:hypothetical protein
VAADYVSLKKWHFQHLSTYIPAAVRSTLATEFNGEVAFGVPQPAANRADQASLGAIGINNNNYIRSDGQNVGCAVVWCPKRLPSSACTATALTVWPAP